MKEKIDGLFMAIVAALISGVAIFLSKQYLSLGIQPEVLITLRGGIVVLIFTAFLFLTKKISTLKDLYPGQWIGLILIGIFGGFLSFLFFFRGLSMVGGLNGAFAHKLIFIFIIPLAWIFLKEKTNWRIAVLGGLILVGNSILYGSLKIFSNFGQGDLLILLAVFLWACENVASKHLLKSLSVEIVVWARMFFGLICMIMMLSYKGEMNLLLDLSLIQTIKLGILSIILFLFLSSWYGAIKRIKVSSAAVVLALGFPVSKILSVLSGNEIFFPHYILGFFLVVIPFGFVIKGLFDGIYLIQIEEDSREYIY